MRHGLLSPLCMAVTFLLHLPVQPAAAGRASTGRSRPRPPHEILLAPGDDSHAAALAAFERLLADYGRPAPAQPAGGWPGVEPPPGRRLPGAGLDPASRRIELPGGTGGGDGGHGWASFTGTWTLDDAAHLLNRALIGPRFEEFTAARDQGLPATLDALLTPDPLPVQPFPWVYDTPPNTTGWTQAQKDSLNQLYTERQKLLRLWWTTQIVSGQTGMTETMTHFWHDHFATKASTVYYPQSVFINNDLLRRNALGNYKDLARAVATDPAMLIFLDGTKNKKNAPNENFAREMMELFTMGEGSGYTQQDVTEAARACTGWQTDGINAYFTPSRFDTGTKTILGQTGPWGMDDFVRILFEQDATARYLCTKLYRWFMDDEPSPSDIETLARILRDNDYEVAPVLRVMLGSAQFYDPQFRGSMIRDGVDIYAGMLRRWHVAGFDPLATPVNNQRTWILNQMTAYNHILMEPPDVSGWPGHRNWINSYTLPNRKNYSVNLVDGQLSPSKPLGLSLDVMTESAALSNPNDVYALIDDVARLCFGQPPTDLVRQEMIDALLQGELPYNWSLNLPDADARLRDLYSFVMRLPDYQLK